MSTFGDLERAFADLYPYRWAFAAGFIVFMGAFFAYAYWKDWHRFVWRYRVRLGIISAPFLVVTLWLGWSLGSPLFTNTTVDEEFPFAATATVPSDMDMATVDLIMAGMAQVESQVSEGMPVMPAKAADQQPNVIPNDPGADVPTLVPGTAAGESAEPAAAPAVVKKGQFQDIDGFHKGSGTATIYHGPDGSRLLRLEDFNVTNGPDSTSSYHLIGGRGSATQGDCNHPAGWTSEN